MEENGDLYKHDLSCPKCNKKTLKRTLGNSYFGCTFTICEDFFNCDYYKIEEIKSLAIEANDERMKREEDWYTQRIQLFLERDKKKIKEEFIRKEMDRMRGGY
ncbi:hypothetical protein MBCUT_05310 [Methanobrevibacter cuticularis]|uniref:Uncharacterized protein n=1 Tax=Methanobrevibacter cuticularis TaxID=47311 RepID=A0A166EMD7_9EURY|nr:hypothetical protein [Methanobrevibacter cuticularis]KZX16812.1 hypothetical protein MBCUT_05310 [Methanobrevibacter cuticularis]